MKLPDLGSMTDFTMAFQPIVDVARREIFAHEALVRGTHGEGAAAVFARIEPEERFAFDQACRAKAIEQAAMLGMQSKLSLNVLPRDVCGHEECFRSAMAVAKRCNFPVDRLIFEITEAERTEDIPRLVSVFQTYKQYGFTSAIDDFGAGFAGFELFAGFQPDIIKIDMHLVRNIHTDRVRRAIVKGFVAICEELDMKVIAEGVEAPEEVQVLRELGIVLFQGYFFARPTVGALPAVEW
ncbi:EAL domain-containing protein [Variovorax sp. LjRoot178]|uniref:EAL domain-containing protein n=1 Tax=Variovorax sp. LjRoot178 TaxID=3342277 RepID=UPI003F517C08